ncbi:MAG TPA: amidase [Burkholderiales bacterium]|nr:amidase [Burkholderiales bacterium]
MSETGAGHPRGEAHAIVGAGVLGLAASVRAGRVSARDAVDCYLERIARHGSELGAFLAVSGTAARDAAASLDRRRREGSPLGALAGVPFAVKDNLDVAGLPTSAGMVALRGTMPERDAVAVERLRAAGAVPLGKTSMDEAAFGATNDNPHFGRCRNPHRLEFTPGGSSGGSAAAVAAGLAAAALGSDTLGSVRIPASYCGCAGFKPTRGSIPTAGLMPLSVSLDEIGVLARSVGDCAVVFEAIRDAGSGTAGSRSPLRARVGVLTGLDVAPEIAAAVARAAAVLKASGYVVGNCDLAGIDPGRVRRAGLLIAEAEGARVHARLLSDPASGISKSLREALAYGAAQAPERIAQARAVLHDARQGLDALFASVDLLLLPTTPQTAFAFASPAPSSQADFTALANAGGMPALSLAAGLSSEGLPLGVQLVAARGADALVLEAGQACEAVLGFFPPPMLGVC